MVIPIIIAFYIVIFSTDYALFRSNFVEIDNTFKAVFYEILDNRKRVEDILKKVDDLKDAWIRLEENQWIYEKTVVRESYSLDTRYFYQYLPNNAFSVLIDHNFDQIVKGARIKADINYYHQIARFYFHCVKTSESTQRIEDEINAKISTIRTLKKNLEENIFVPVKDSSGNLNIFFPSKEIDDASSFASATPICYPISQKKNGSVYPDNDNKDYITQDGKIDSQKWKDFVEKKVVIIIECFKRFQEKETSHCPDIKNIVSYNDFFSTIIESDTLFPPSFYSQIVGTWKPWVYLILISSFLAIWGTVFLITGIFNVLIIFFSGLLIYLIFCILFVIALTILFIIHLLFF